MDQFLNACNNEMWPYEDLRSVVIIQQSIYESSVHWVRKSVAALRDKLSERKVKLKHFVRWWFVLARDHTYNVSTLDREKYARHDS